MAITPLPTPPSRGDEPTTFRTDADAFLGALPTFATEANALAVEVGDDATAAAASATAAADSALQASSSASSASGSASAASSAASAAGDSATNAAASLSSFRAVYLGEAASDPTTDLNGDPLDGGEVYWNTTDAAPKIYSGGAWRTAVLDASGALLAANNLADLASASAARSNLGLGTAATTDATDYAKAAWSTQTATYTAAAGDRILADTSGGAFTITLPFSPSSGDEVWFADPGANWATNNLTVDGSGNNIDSASTFAADVNEGAFIAVYDGTAWVVRFATGVV